MDREGRRSPTWIGGMTGFTRGRYAQRSVVGVDRLVVISLVTTHAGAGGVVVVSIWVTTVAIGCCMSSR